MIQGSRLPVCVCIVVTTGTVWLVCHWSKCTMRASKGFVNVRVLVVACVSVFVFVLVRVLELAAVASWVVKAVFRVCASDANLLTGNIQ
jgi:hypothetical protein